MSEALKVTDDLGKITFFGSKLKREMKDMLIQASISMSTTQVAQLSMTFIDYGFKEFNKGIYVPGIPVKFEDLWLEVGSVDTLEQAGTEAVSVRCRSRTVRKLKKRQGRKVLKNASPSDFVKQECKAVGAKFVVQDTHKRKQVARDVKGKNYTKGAETPSSWTTFQRLAQEVGFVIFEVAGKVYFGQPTWLLEQTKDKPVVVTWRRGDKKLHPISTPRCSMTVDGDTVAQVVVELPRERARECRPGKALLLKGVPNFEDPYLITSVDYSLLGDGHISVTAGTPINPEKMKRKKSGGSGGGKGLRSNSLRDLLKYVGFKGEGLEMAIAIVMAESGGRPGAKGDISLQNAKWGPSIGLFQIRSLKNPGAYSGTDAMRIASKLSDPIYNAKLAFKMSNGGQNWGAWSTYTNASYRQYYRTGTNYTVSGWSVPESHKPQAAPSGPARRGTKSALDFTMFCLQQAGDRYVFGAEASLSDPDPDVWDCSELIQWAAHQVGVNFPDGSSNQIAASRRISVSDAIRTRGAVLYKPGHIAVSLGNGRTIEALNPGYGVVSMSATARSFNWTAGGLIPGMRY